jgi:hypothetical protein
VVNAPGGWSMPHPDCFNPGSKTVAIVQDTGWARGPVWTGAENLAPTRISSLDCPAHSESLYSLSYPGPLSSFLTWRNQTVSVLTLSAHNNNACLVINAGQFEVVSVGRPNDHTLPFRAFNKVHNLKLSICVQHFA